MYCPLLRTLSMRLLAQVARVYLRLLRYSEWLVVDVSCTSPLYRISCDSLSFPNLRSSDRDRLKNGGVFLTYDQVQYYGRYPGVNKDDIEVVPCGQCKSCRLKHAFEWAVRCSLEASLHTTNYFVTLTYSEESLPRGNFIDENKQIYNSTLRRRDIQLFVKKLRELERRKFGNDHIKVFYCGEYGSDEFTSRPHYHLIVFGATELPDLTYHHTTGSYKYYKSALYERCWSDDSLGVPVLRGHVDISESSFDTVAYTAKYCLKKITGKLKKSFMFYYDSLDEEQRPDLRLPPFIGMSLKPAIAVDFYHQNKLQIYDEDLVKYQRKFKLYTSKPPKYFDKLFDQDYPEEMDRIKRKRKAVGIAASDARKSLYSEDYLERLAREAELVERKEARRVRSL